MLSLNSYLTSSLKQIFKLVLLMTSEVKMNEILEGIRQATAKGEPVQKVVRSFINAGYSVEEINKALALMNQSQPLVQTPSAHPLPITPIPKPSTPVSFRPVQVPNYTLPKVQQTPEASVYAPPQHKEVGNGIIIVMVVVLLLLLGILGAVVFFKDQLLALI